VAPVFFFEEWELFLLQLEVQRYYGVDLQILYIMSMLDDIYRLVEV